MSEYKPGKSKEKMGETRYTEDGLIILPPNVLIQKKNLRTFPQIRPMVIEVFKDPIEEIMDVLDIIKLLEDDYDEL